jgi:hypothetical protein
MAAVTPSAVRGVVLSTGRTVAGLACSPGEVLFLGRPNADRQERALLGGGARPGEDDPRLERIVLLDDVALLPGAVRAALLVGRREGRGVALKPCGELARFLEESTFGRRGPLIAYLPPGEPAVPAVLEALPEMELPVRERLLDMPVHRTQFGADLVQVPLSDQLIFPVGHWLQVLWANLLGLGPFLWQELAGRTASQVVFNLAWAWFGCWSTDPRSLAAQLRKRGRGCRIHPSAVVEGCWLGDAVEIGANAVVRGCVLGDGARVEELAVADFSVLGRQAVIQRQALVRFCLLERGSTCAGQMQLGVLGAEAALKHGATLMDINYAQGVRVMAEGALHPAPLGIAGVCVGPRTIVGSGLKIASGRTVPPDLVVLPAPSGVLARIPEPCASGHYQVVDGGLERA